MHIERNHDVAATRVEVMIFDDKGGGSYGGGQLLRRLRSRCVAEAPTKKAASAPATVDIRFSGWFFVEVLRFSFFIRKAVRSRGTACNPGCIAYTDDRGPRSGFG